MADGIVWNLASKALEVLANSALQEAASWWGARDDLDKLRKTMRMIQARVRDAERQQEGENSDAIKEWLRRLRQVLYRADDLYDEVLTLDVLKQQQMEKSMLCKVGILFSKFGPLCYNKKLANEIKSIRKELDAIKSEMANLNLRNLPAQEPPMARLMENRETASYVDIENVVGRDDEKNMIIEMLLDSKYDGENITIIPIVGFGGFGKTTLAQLVINDKMVYQNFNLIKWTYVPEKDNMKAIMGKIFYAFTGRDYNRVPLEDIKQGIRESIATNKYLLVLDDLWDEEPVRLIDLVNLLKCGKNGSKVIVTTRSDEIAKFIGTIKVPHKLGTLTDDQSWRLFKKLAFKVGQEEKNPALSTVGREIVKMCGNVPLAIKVIGGSLRSKDTKEQWLQVRDSQRSKGDNIMGVLKLSYDYLPPKLKQCFAYFSMFPKGSWFKKDNLAQLWMAQGYFEPSNEDIGDQYFSELLARNFFQNLEITDERYVKRCKMHDLLHDLAKEVAGDEILLLDDESTVQIQDSLVHINLDYLKCPPLLKAARNLRSLLGINYHANDNKIFSKIQSLRVLSLRYVEGNELPNSIGKLIHLRYLKLECEKIEYLPGSITRLVNLQTLKLQSCRKLKELPRDFGKLVKLRHLLLPSNLTDLPPGFGKLTFLQELDIFIVGKGNGLDSLGAWNHRQKLDIKFLMWRRNAIEEVKRANLKNNHPLTYLTLRLGFGKEECTPAAGEMNEMLRCLQLPSNLKELRVWDYKGDEMPVRWLDGLSQLVSIGIIDCKECKVLPKLSWLPHLKSLELSNLDELEYVEDEDEENIRVCTTSATHNNNRCFFPSLEFLLIEYCYKLKGWRRSTSKDDGERWQLVFPCLLKMEVEECPMLMSMPLAPKLESLLVSEINWKMVESNKVRSNDDNEKEAAASSSSASSSSSSSLTLSTSLKELRIYRVDNGLITLSISSSMCNLTIRQCSELRNLRFESPNSIRELEISECRRLKDISEWLQHLCGLEELLIRDCEELEIEEEEEQQREEEEDEEEGKSSSGGWQGLRSLYELILEKIPKMKTLPRGMGCIKTLEELKVKDMENLTEIPEEIGNLSLLRELWIEGCPKVKSLPPSILGLPMLQELWIRNMENLTELPEGDIDNCNGNLPLLDWLRIEDCPKMTSLPTLIQGLTSLQTLFIEGCPDLGKKNMPGGEDWHLIQHIPDLRISDGSKRYTRRDGKESIEDC